jgi:hypothetical protein
MGLLDDAIREHMELKRRRGADPGEVAQQERDALGPVVGGHDAEEEGAFEDGEDGDHVGGEHSDHAVEESDSVHADHSAHQDFGHQGFGHADLHADPDPAHEEGTHGGDGDLLSIDPHPARGDDFANVGQETAELDMRTVLDGELEDVDSVGQLVDPVAPTEHLDSELVEEAPGVPGETPGQERLWFDQQQAQAPRDFDFDP